MSHRRPIEIKTASTKTAMADAAKRQSDQLTSTASIDYLRHHKVPSTLNDILRQVLEEKPQNPLAFMERQLRTLALKIKLKKVAESKQPVPQTAKKAEATTAHPAQASSNVHRATGGEPSAPAEVSDVPVTAEHKSVLPAVHDADQVVNISLAHPPSEAHDATGTIVVDGTQTADAGAERHPVEYGKVEEAPTHTENTDEDAPAASPTNAVPDAPQPEPTELKAPVVEPHALDPTNVPPAEDAIKAPDALPLSDAAGDGDPKPSPLPTDSDVTADTAVEITEQGIAEE